MLRYRPALTARSEKSAEPRTWVFLFESSGDRDPLLARTQIEIMRALLGNAEHADTFAILTAGTNVRTFAPEPLPVTAENVQAGLAYLDKTHLIGALDLAKALDEAGRFLSGARNPYLVHLGSGVAAMGERRDDVLAKRLPEGTRYVGVGVGKRWNRAFMKAAAERTGGFFTQINPDEPVAWRGFELHAALTMPRLLDIKVSDDAGRPFLAVTNSMTAGEEICAAIRLDADDPRLPQSVRVAGSLDGEPFERVLPVKDVAANAGYLPRTWAKLEIDRLLAEDTAKNRERVIELSKAMYVMTPFTSLLVLENEQMYRENKVDRGRKDHWAMYPCPEKIPVVYEPDPNSPPGTNRPGDQKPTVQEVLQTILVRVPPRCLNWPNEGGGPNGPAVTAIMLYVGAFAAPDPEVELASLGDLADKRLGKRLQEVDYDGIVMFDAERFGEPAVPADFLAREGLQAALPPPVQKARTRKAGLPRVSRPLMERSRAVRYTYTRGGEGRDEGERRKSEWSDWSLGLRLDMTDEPGRDFGFAVNGKSSLLRSRGEALGVDWGEVDRKKSWSALQRDALGRDMYAESATPLFVVPPDLRTGRDARESNESDGRWVVATVTRSVDEGKKRVFFRHPDAIDRLLSGGGAPRLYSRPSFSGDERLFSDLVSYAPGMNTSTADIRAVLEAEAAPRFANLPGRIDPAARKLIDRARGAGWQTLTVAGKDGKPALSLAFDGDGRYAYQRTLPSGLRERVVCDGRTLLHLYPDLGVGARRTVSRFHRADFAGVVPWLVPPAEDLAHGADVTALDEHTVAVSPRDAAEAKGDDGKPIPYLRLHLIFGEDGRLNERRLVLMPEGKTLAGETYAADGTVKRLDGDGKEVAKFQRTLGPAPAPDLKPSTSALVVLPLPLRSRVTVFHKFGFDPNKSLDTDENRCHHYLDDESALEMFAAEYAAQNPANARSLYRDCFAPDDPRAAGFRVLLTSCGDPTPALRDLQSQRAERPNDPLLLYLSLLDLPLYRTWQPYLGLDTATAVCKESPFLGKLAAFRDQWLTWQVWRGVDAAQEEDRWFRERQVRGLEFVRAHAGTALGWALLGTMRDCAGSDERFHRELAEACNLFADHPALGYPARYERARALLWGGRRDEARALFREMFQEALKAGVLPAIDGTFREALQGDEKDADLWTEMMRQTAAEFCAKQRRPAAVALAWQCWQLGDQPLASNLLAAALDGPAEGDERLLTTLAAVGFLSQTGQHAAADARLRPLLEDKDLSAQPALWRMAGRIADSRGMEARSIECLERALALEYEDLPEVIRLEEVRRDYGRLLDHYSSLARAASAMKIDPPRDLPARVVRAADCWRALDRDESARPCEKAAEILRSLGAADLAWEYLTTPIGQRPNESGPWLGLAQSLQREGDFALADRAYAAAFEAEPTNAQILWDRAQALRQNGHTEEARKLLRQIIDGDWQPRFAWIRSQAKWQLEGR
jgi:tetratricopeptide (TPR) repeat protein